MTLLAGTLDVDDPSAVTGSGLALAIFNGITASTPADAKTRVAPSLKPFCEGLAEAIVDHLVSNAAITVTVHTSDTGLQTTPNPNNPSTATAGPASNKQLSGALT